MADTPRERALDFLYAGLEAGRPDGDSDRHFDEAGATALEAIGLITPAERMAWLAAIADPVVPAAPLPEADAVLGELLERVPPYDDDGDSEERQLFEGALDALAATGAADHAGWDARLRRHVGLPTEEEERVEERALNAGGTEQELLAVLPGPPEAVDGVRVLFALRFADGISFEVHFEGDHEDWFRDGSLDLEMLRDDVGTTYVPDGGGGGHHSLHLTFRTPPPADATWVELAGVASQPVRVWL